MSGDIINLLQKGCDLQNDTIVSRSSLVISLIALIYTAQTFYLKKGNKFRSSYSTTTTSDGDTYVKSVTIENQKDKPLVIHNIFLKVGHNHYFNVESFDNKPLIINPFEVYQKEYDDILFYVCNLKRYSNVKLFKNGFKDKRIYLETSEQGQNSTILRGLFKNYSIGVFDPIRVYYEGKSYGYGVAYLLECQFEDGNKYIRTVSDYETQKHYETWFNKYLGIKYSKYCFESGEYLQQFVDYRISNGGGEYKNFRLVSVKVIDRHKYVNEILGEEYRDRETLERINRPGFHILCPILTKISKIKTWFTNRKHKSNRKTPRNDITIA